MKTLCLLIALFAASTAFSADEGRQALPVDKNQLEEKLAVQIQTSFEDKARLLMDQINASNLSEEYIGHYALTSTEPFVLLVQWSTGTVCEMTEVFLVSPLDGPKVSLTLEQVCPGQTQKTYFQQLKGQNTFSQRNLPVQ